MMKWVVSVCVSLYQIVKEIELTKACRKQALLRCLFELEQIQMSGVFVDERGCRM